MAVISYRRILIFVFLLGAIALSLQAKDFVLIYPVLHPFFRDTSIGARDQAKLMEGINIIISGPYKQSPEEQITILEKFIDDQVDAIAIGPTDEDKLIPFINTAMQRGIPVLCIDTDSPNSDRLTFIGTDNYQAGFEMGKQVADFLGGKGKVVISITTLKTRNMMQRVEGFKNFILKESEITILEIKEGS